jgi:hypothetical protein
MRLLNKSQKRSAAVNQWSRTTFPLLFSGISSIACAQSYWGQTGSIRLAGTGCNAVVYVPVPNPNNLSQLNNLWAGRQYYQTSGAGAGTPYPQGTGCDAIPTSNQGLVLDTLSVSNAAFTLSQGLLAYNATISNTGYTGQNGWQFDSVYDPYVVYYNGQYLVSFECNFVSSVTAAVGASSCLAVLDPTTLTLSNIELVVTGLDTSDNGQDYFYSASVPRLVAYNGKLYMYYSAVKKNVTTDDHSVKGVEVYGVRLWPDANGFYWATQTSGEIVSSTQSASTRVWAKGTTDLTDTYVGMKSVWVDGSGELVMLAVVGGTGVKGKINGTDWYQNPLPPGCTGPSGEEQDCAAMAIATSTTPLDDNTFGSNDSIDAADLPTNAIDYTIPVQYNGTWMLFSNFYGPYDNGYSTVQPVPGTGYPSPGTDYMCVIPFGDARLYPTGPL